MRPTQQQLHTRAGCLSSCNHCKCRRETRGWQKVFKHEKRATRRNNRPQCVLPHSHTHITRAKKVKTYSARIEKYVTRLFKYYFAREGYRRCTHRRVLHVLTLRLSRHKRISKKSHCARSVSLLPFIPGASTKLSARAAIFLIYQSNPPALWMREHTPRALFITLPCRQNSCRHQNFWCSPLYLVAPDKNKSERDKSWQ